MDTCNGCTYFAALPKECHKNAPAAFVVPQGILGVFPPTKPENWCGEFKRAEVASTEGETSC